MFPTRVAAVLRARGGRELRAPRPPHPKRHRGAKRRLPDPPRRIPRLLRTRAGGKRGAHLPGPAARLPSEHSGQYFFFLIATFFPHPKTAYRAALIFFFCFRYFKIWFFKVRFEEKITSSRSPFTSPCLPQTPGQNRDEFREND